VAKWWVPDDVVFVEQLPHTATEAAEDEITAGVQGLQAAGA